MARNRTRIPRPVPTDPAGRAAETRRRLDGRTRVLLVVLILFALLLYSIAMVRLSGGIA